MHGFAPGSLKTPDMTSERERSINTAVHDSSYEKSSAGILCALGEPEARTYLTVGYEPSNLTPFSSGSTLSPSAKKRQVTKKTVLERQVCETEDPSQKRNEMGK